MASSRFQAKHFTNVLNFLFCISKGTNKCQNVIWYVFIKSQINTLQQSIYSTIGLWKGNNVSSDMFLCHWFSRFTWAKPGEQCRASARQFRSIDLHSQRVCWDRSRVEQHRARCELKTLKRAEYRDMLMVTPACLQSE